MIFYDFSETSAEKTIEKIVYEGLTLLHSAKGVFKMRSHAIKFSEEVNKILNIINYEKKDLSYLLAIQKIQ